MKKYEKSEENQLIHSEAFCLIRVSYIRKTEKKKKTRGRKNNIRKLPRNEGHEFF